MTLSTVKVGDKIHITLSTGATIGEVVRITPTMVCTENERFYIKNGNAVGATDTWGHKSVASVLTDAARAKIISDRTRRAIVNAATSTKTINLLREESNEFLVSFLKTIYSDRSINEMIERCETV